ncbi:MAG: hypothetical protein NBV67_10735, partial [Tagaea sp.]|nr:hypothetical protein [Tagaea sp.]
RPAKRSPLDRDPTPVVVPAPKSGLPFERGWRPASATQNFLAFALARPFRTHIRRPDGSLLRVRIAAVTSGKRSFDIQGDGKTPRFAVLIEPRRRGDDLPPEGRYDLVSDCAWLGRLKNVPLRHVPKTLRERVRARGYFHVL